MANKIKLLLKIILAIVVITLIVYAFLPERIKVDMTIVEKGDLLVTLEGEGKTRIHDIYVVSAPMEGRITRIDSEAGDIVKAGETIIANMNPANPRFLDKRTESQAKADIEGAKAALALATTRVKQSQAQVEYNLADFKRTKELYQKKLVTKADLEKAELRSITLRAELDTAVSNQRVMDSRLEVAEASLLQPDELQDKMGKTDCNICIHAPVDGTVLRILHKSEGIVSVGTPLVEIGNPADLEVNIEMLSANAVKVDVGDLALIKRWGGDNDLNAMVRVVEPSGFTKVSALGIEEQRVNIIVNFIDPIEKWRALGDAFRVEAAIIIDRADDVIMVPLSTLFRQNEIWSVFKVIDGVVALQVVDVGRRNDRHAEVTSGLVAGDHVITHPGNSIKAGVRVQER